jgi:4'-phosphopantetheinyl transferase
MRSTTGRELTAPDGVLQWLRQCVPYDRLFSSARGVDGVGHAFLRFDPVRFETDSRLQPPSKIVSDDVQVWAFSLDLDGVDLTVATRSLSRDELERADRLVSERNRRQFIAAHAILREVLSRYCGRRPQELLFHKTAAGKPFLASERAIRFNLTHSHGRALIAVASDREVGVDLEKLRPEVDVVGLAERFFSSQDQAFVKRGDPTKIRERFLQAWVAREAVFKAEGKGITFPLHHDHVELSSDGKEAHLIREGRNPAVKFPVRFLALDPGWVGAVATEGTSWTVSYRSFRGS